MVLCRCGRPLSEHTLDAPFTAQPSTWNPKSCPGWSPVTIRFDPEAPVPA